MQANSSIAVPRWITALLATLAVLAVVGLVYQNYRLGEPPWALAVSALLLAIPIGLLFFSIWVLLLVWRQRRLRGGVSGRPAAFIYWTPRLAGVAIALFVSLFALDVFEMEGTFWEKVGGFIIHAAPAIIMLAVLILAWRRPAIGFIVFALAALYFLRFILGRPPDLANLLLFSGPMALIAAMYWVNWKWASPGRRA